MIRTNNRSDRQVELAQRADMLARLVRCAPRFGDALRWWAGFDLARQPRVPDEDYILDNQAALLLDLPPGTSVTRRDGYLVAALPGEGFRVAAAVTLVHVPALGLDLARRDALRAGTVPLSQLLGGVHRATHYAYRLGGDPLDDQPALHSRSTLLCAGRPVAVVCETVYWRLLTHRAPGYPSRYLHLPLQQPTGWGPP